MFDPRVIRDKLKIAQLFFKVSSYTALQKLVETQMEQLKENKIKVEIKYTKDEFTTRVGFILGPATDWTLITSHEYLIITKHSIDALHFKIRKEWVYERNYKAKVLVVYAILLQREQID